MAHDVFISYSSKDKPTADAACAALESRGIRCWIAPRDVYPGEEYAASLVRALHESRVMVLVFSSGANRSPQVLREVERAVSRGVPILPLRIEDVPPSEAMEYYISSRHWLDALSPPLEEHLVRLADTVKVLLSRANDDVAPHPYEPAVQVVGTVRNVEPQVSEHPASRTPPLAPENFQPTPNASTKPTAKFASTTVVLITLVAVLSVAVVLIVIHFRSASATAETAAQSHAPATPDTTQRPAAPDATQSSNSPQANPSNPSADVNSQPASASQPAPSSSSLPSGSTLAGSPSANLHKSPTSSRTNLAPATSSAASVMSSAQQFSQGMNFYQAGQYAQALTLFRESAAQGNAPAENYLGLMYMNGVGVTTDYAQALSWYNKAAAQGNFSGECNLGIMYDRGLGVPKDKVTAYMWYILATQSGSPLAPKNAKLLAPQLTPQQLNEAQRRASALKARQK